MFKSEEFIFPLKISLVISFVLKYLANYNKKYQKVNPQEIYKMPISIHQININSIIVFMRTAEGFYIHND